MDAHCLYRGLRERHGNGDLDRRDFLAALGRMAMAAGLAGPGVAAFAGPAQAAGSIRYDGWGGLAQDSLDKFVFKPAMEKAGGTMRQGSFGSVEEMLAKVRAGSPGDYNLSSFNTQLAYKQFWDLGLTQGLDEARLPGLSVMDGRALSGFRTLSDGKLCAVPTILTTVGIIYNTSQIQLAELKQKQANILLEPRLKGKLSGENNWLKRIWYAALQSGQDPNAIKDMDAIWEKIRESRSMVVKYWGSGAEQINLMMNGTALVEDGWGATVTRMRRQGLPLDIFFPDGIYTDTGGILVLKGTPMDLAYQVFDVLLQPEVQFALADQGGYTPLCDPAKVEIPTALRKDLPGYDEAGKLRLSTFVNTDYWSQNALAWQRRYTQLMARG